MAGNDPREEERDREAARGDEASAGAEGEGEEEEAASTPFDNPFFLPVVLLGFALWFTYDGWFNPEMEWVKFNQGGAVVTWALGLFYLARALRERRRAASDEEPSEGSS